MVIFTFFNVFLAIENTGTEVDSIEIEIVSESSGLRGFMKILLYVCSSISLVLFVAVVVIILRNLGKDKKNLKKEKKKALVSVDVEEIAIERYFPTADKKVGLALLQKAGIYKKRDKLGRRNTAVEEVEEEVCPLCTKNFACLTDEKPKTIKNSKRLYHPLCLKRWVKKKKQCPETLKRIKSILEKSIARISQLELDLPVENQSAHGKMAVGSKTSFFAEGGTPKSNVGKKKKRKSSINFMRLNLKSGDNSTKKLNSKSPRNPLMSPNHRKDDSNSGSEKFQISPQYINVLNKSDKKKKENSPQRPQRRGYKKKQKTILEKTPEEIEARKRAWRKKRGVTYNTIDTRKQNKRSDIVGTSNMNLLHSKNDKRDESFHFDDIRMKRSSSIKKMERKESPPHQFSSPQLKKKSFKRVGEDDGGERDDGFKLRLKNMINMEKRKKNRRKNSSHKKSVSIRMEESDISIDESSFGV